MAIKKKPTMWLYPIAPTTKFNVGAVISKQTGAVGFAEMIEHDAGDDIWGLTTNFKNIVVEDEMLVYAAKNRGNPPLLIGLGNVIEGPWQDGDEHLIKIKWNVPVCRQLGKHPIDATWIAQHLPITKRTAMAIPPELWPTIRKQLSAPLSDPLEDISKIVSSPKLSKTVKRLLIDARLGQGMFKNSVCRIEDGCRLTGVTDRAHLRASHIKPWAVSTNQERLDGNNGLLLAPHVDHLFDRGFISFNSKGKLLISPQLPSGVLKAWSLPAKGSFGAFNKAQRKYLEYHRKSVFRS